MGPRGQFQSPPRGRSVPPLIALCPPRLRISPCLPACIASASAAQRRQRAAAAAAADAKPRQAVGPWAAAGRRASRLGAPSIATQGKAAQREATQSDGRQAAGQRGRTGDETRRREPPSMPRSAPSGAPFQKGWRPRQKVLRRRCDPDVKEQQKGRDTRRAGAQPTHIDDAQGRTNDAPATSGARIRAQSNCNNTRQGRAGQAGQGRASRR